MGAPNDVLFLRFYGADDAPPPLRPTTLATCTGLLENVIKSPFPQTQGPLRRSVLNIVASPRHGCLEVLLQLDLSISIGVSAFRIFGDQSPDAQKLLVETREWSEFLLLLVFGGRGLLDLYIHGQQSPKGAPPDEELQTLAVSLAPDLIKQAQVLKAVRDLCEFGKKSGFTRIEVQLRDQPRLAIHDDSPEPRSQIGRTYLAQHPQFFAIPPGQITIHTSAHSTTPIGVRVDDRELKAIVADYIAPDSKKRTMILAAWGSKRPLPKSGQRIDVIGRPIDVSAVDVTRPVADLHEKAGAVFLVEKQIVAE